MQFFRHFVLFFIDFLDSWLKDDLELAVFQKRVIAIYAISRPVAILQR